MTVPKVLTKSPKARKVLIKKAEHLHEQLGDLSRAFFVQSCPYPSVGTTEGTRAPLGETVLKNTDERSIEQVASNRAQPYSLPVAANSATGRENPSESRRNSAPITIAGAFFTPAFQCYGGCAWADFGLAGFLDSRFLTPRTAATPSREKDGGSSSSQGATPMTSIIPPAIRIAAHRAMALAALRKNSSLSVRLKRYNHHMDQVRALEAQGGTQ